MVYRRNKEEMGLWLTIVMVLGKRIQKNCQLGQLVVNCYNIMYKPLIIVWLTSWRKIWRAKCFFRMMMSHHHPLSPFFIKPVNLSTERPCPFVHKLHSGWPLVDKFPFSWQLQRQRMGKHKCIVFGSWKKE
jgi:hypothetical protein